MKLVARREHWPVAGTFTISRGTYTQIEVVVVELEEDGARGRGECRPYPRYGQDAESALAQILDLAPRIEHGISRAELRDAMKPCAARNALDAALWDLEAKRSGRRVFELAGLSAPQPVVTAFTISLDRPEVMAAAAKAAARPLLKLKLGRDGDEERVAAVRFAVPEATLIVDANEAWAADDLATKLDAMAVLGVELVEQPLHADHDGALRAGEFAVPLCADESCHGLDRLDEVFARYDAVNVKLDKTGGLTEAIEVVRRARAAGKDVMIGCMLGTSLAMAPALMLTSSAKFVDLDGPLLLGRDRVPGLVYEHDRVVPPRPELWG